jgi:hypothetical protein
MSFFHMKSSKKHVEKPLVWLDMLMPKNLKQACYFNVHCIYNAHIMC